jgi:hypothetical protein
MVIGFLALGFRDNLPSYRHLFFFEGAGGACAPTEILLKRNKQGVQQRARTSFFFVPKKRRRGRFLAGSLRNKKRNKENEQNYTSCSSHELI